MAYTRQIDIIPTRTIPIGRRFFLPGRRYLGPPIKFPTVRHGYNRYIGPSIPVPYSRYKQSYGLSGPFETTPAYEKHDPRYWVCKRRRRPLPSPKPGPFGIG